MKIALCSGSFKPEVNDHTCTIYDILVIAEKYGFSGLEVREDLLNNKPADLPHLQKLAAEKGMALIYACLNWPVNKDVSVMQENAQTLIQRMDEAVVLGSSLLKTGFGPVDNLVEMTNAHFKVLAGLAEAAETRNIMLCLENSDKSSGSNAYTIREILEKVNSTSLRVTYDGGNLAAAGKDPVAALEILVDHVAYVHLKDFQKGETVYTYMGNGDVNYAEIFRILRDSEYRGYGCFEFPMKTNRLIEVEKSLKYMEENKWN